MLGLVTPPAMALGLCGVDEPFCCNVTVGAVTYITNTPSSRTGGREMNPAPVLKHDYNKYKKVGSDRHESKEMECSFIGPSIC